MAGISLRKCSLIYLQGPEKFSNCLRSHSTAELINVTVWPWKLFSSPVQSKWALGPPTEGGSGTRSLGKAVETEKTQCSNHTVLLVSSIMALSLRELGHPVRPRTQARGDLSLAVPRQCKPQGK